MGGIIGPMSLAVTTTIEQRTSRMPSSFAIGNMMGASSSTITVNSTALNHSSGRISLATTRPLVGACAC